MTVKTIQLKFAIFNFAFWRPVCWPVRVKGRRSFFFWQSGSEGCPPWTSVCYGTTHERNWSLTLDLWRGGYQNAKPIIANFHWSFFLDNAVKYMHLIPCSWSVRDHVQSSMPKKRKLLTKGAGGGGGSGPLVKPYETLLFFFSNEILIMNVISAIISNL